MMFLKVLLGFVFLLGSADILVRGGVGLAERLNISPLVIGMTIIAFGTSAPELLVRELVDRLAERFAISEREVETTRETIAFKLPRGLEEAA